MKKNENEGTCDRAEVHAAFWWGKTERKKLLGRPRCGWVDDIKTELQRNITERVRTRLMWFRRGTSGVIL
jgi:hypothetical protein